MMCIASVNKLVIGVYLVTIANAWVSESTYCFGTSLFQQLFKNMDVCKSEFIFSFTYRQHLNYRLTSFPTTVFKTLCVLYLNTTSPFNLLWTILIASSTINFKLKTCFITIALQYWLTLHYTIIGIEEQKDRVTNTISLRKIETFHMRHENYHESALKVYHRVSYICH